MKHLVLYIDKTYSVKEGPVDLQSIYETLRVSSIERAPSNLHEYVIYADEEGLINGSEANESADLLTDHLHSYGIRGNVLVLRDNDEEESPLTEEDVKFLLEKSGNPIKRP